MRASIGRTAERTTGVRPRPQRTRARDVVVFGSMKVPSTAGRPTLPGFERPPVAEVALGVQFRPLPQLRPLELGALREQWRPEYPIAQEQPPLPPATEGFAPGLPSVQFVIGSAPQTRLWFVREDQTGLLQLQPDRFVVNWRQASSTKPYPRYPSVRAEFEHRFDELAQYLRERSLGALDITQVEITYINATSTPTNRACITMKVAQRSRGIARLAAARSTRSTIRSFGGPLVHRRTRS